jgi:hypothetical protein
MTRHPASDEGSCEENAAFLDESVCNNKQFSQRLTDCLKCYRPAVSSVNFHVPDLRVNDDNGSYTA